jgi:hypothetical protein
MAVLIKVSSIQWLIPPSRKVTVAPVMMGGQTDAPYVYSIFDPAVLRYGFSLYHFQLGSD